ncbi:MAG TPA: peptidylprolyl isomerase [Caulobacteraceae bacterium]
MAALLLGAAPALAQDAAAPPASSADAGPLQLRGGVAAVVNDNIITNYDLSQRAMLLIMTTGVKPTPENQNQILQQALRSLVDERLQIQELRKMEQTQKFQIVATDKDVDEALTGLARDNNLTLDQFFAQLRATGLDPRTLREQYRAQISWQRMMQGRYGSRIRIGDEQIRQAMQRYEAGTNQPQYALSEIFLDAARVGGMSEAQDGARQLIQQIKEGAPFPAVARQFSGSPTAANGGDMGWVTPSEVPAEVAARLEQLPLRQVSDPIATRDGVYVLYLRDKRAGGEARLVSLRQAAVRLQPTASEAEVQAATARLNQVRAKGPTCETLDAAAAGVEGVVTTTMPEIDANAAPPEFVSAIETLTQGRAAEPVRSAAGMHLLVMCGQRTGSPNKPTRQTVENRLWSEQMAMLSKRYLRDLRSSATIETP